MRAYGFMEIEEGKRTHGMIFRLGAPDRPHLPPARIAGRGCLMGEATAREWHVSPPAEASPSFCRSSPQ